MNPPHLEKLLKHFYFDKENGKFFRKPKGEPAGFLKSNGEVQLRAASLAWPARKVAYWFHTGTYPTEHLRVLDGNPLNLKAENLMTSRDMFTVKNTRTCAHCGNSFKATNQAQKCCSRPCAGMLSRMNQRTKCIDCGSPELKSTGPRCQSCAKDYQRRRSLSSSYGITLEEFNSMLDAEGHTCPICRNPKTEPVVDHDHATGKVRGILCGSCNKAIGFLCDNPEIAEAAANYLRTRK